MSGPIESLPPTDADPDDEAAEPLQFDRAEFATPADDGLPCAVCHRPIAEDYYEINGKVMCPACRHGVESTFRGGSGPGRFFKAVVLGSVAAMVGAVIYYAFIRITDMNWALIAILVGVMVGGAVRKGSGNRGGRLYQLLAVFLTYSSIAAMHLPILLEGAANRPPDPAAAKPAEKAAGEPADPGPARPQADGAAGKDAPAPPPTLSRLVVLFAIVIGFCYTLPVLMAYSAPISGLIYAFALWEAWKLNRGVKLVFNGPFRVGTTGAGVASREGDGDGA